MSQLQDAWKIYSAFSDYWLTKKATVTNEKLRALGVTLTIMKTFDYSPRGIVTEGATEDELFDLYRASYYAFRVMNMEYKKFLVLPRIETEAVRVWYLEIREGWVDSLEKLKPFRNFWISSAGLEGQREATMVIEKACEPTFRNFTF